MDSPRNASCDYHNVIRNVKHFRRVSGARSFIRRRMEQGATLSDHRAALPGEAFGVFIKEMRLLARAVFVIDKKGDPVYTPFLMVS